MISGLKKPCWHFFQSAHLDATAPMIVEKLNGLFNGMTKSIYVWILQKNSLDLVLLVSVGSFLGKEWVFSHKINFVLIKKLID